MKICIVPISLLSLSFHFISFGVQIITLSPDRWQEYKELRLKALADEIETLGACLDDEKNLPDSHWQHNLKSPYLLFAEENRALIGMVDAIRECESGTYSRHLITINNLYILPEMRRMRVAYSLIQHLLSKLVSENTPLNAMLWVIATNEVAIKLYKKCGFKQSGFLEKSVLINGRYLDSIFMQKIIRG